MKSIFFIFLGLLAFSFVFQNCSYPHVQDAPIPPKTVTLKVNNYCPQNGAQFEEIFAYNASTNLEKAQFIPDFDRDGLSDKDELDVQLKQKYNIHVSSKDTNGDYYSDLINIRLGFDKDNQFRFSVCDAGYNDTDLDGLTDCEEAALKIDRLDPDSDQDGIPDGLEGRNHLNPSDNVDSRSDLDQDGLTNLEEVKANSPLKNTNNKYINQISLKYYSENYLTDTGDPCYNLEVSNIPILNVTNGNYVRIYLLESRLEVGGSSSNEVRDLHQINFVIDRQVINESIITIDKDNTTKKQLEIVNLEGI